MPQRGGNFTGGLKIELVGKGVGKHLRQGFSLSGSIQPADFKTFRKNGLDRWSALDHIIQHNGHAVVAQLHAGSQVIHLVRPFVAQGDVDVAGTGQIHSGAHDIPACQRFTLFQEYFFRDVLTLAVFEGIFIHPVAGNADAPLRHQFVVTRVDRENLKFGYFGQDGLGFLALGRIRSGDLNFYKIQVVFFLRADNDVIGPGTVKAVRQDHACLFHGLVRQGNGLAVVSDIRFHAQREGDAPGNVNAVFQPLLEEGEQGKRRNADNENRSGIALDLVLVGTQVPEKHTQQHQTANEDEKRVIEEIVDEGERSGHSARCG